jgi:hypothetical protein
VEVRIILIEFGEKKEPSNDPKRKIKYKKGK